MKNPTSESHKKKLSIQKVTFSHRYTVVPLLADSSSKAFPGRMKWLTSAICTPTLKKINNKTQEASHYTSSEANSHQHKRNFLKLLFRTSDLKANLPSSYSFQQLLHLQVGRVKSITKNEQLQQLWTIKPCVHLVENCIRYQFSSLCLFHFL